MATGPLRQASRGWALRKVYLATLGLGVLSTVAWAFPWDTDMVDAVYKRAYAWDMPTLPDGVISRNHARLPGDRLAPETAAMEIPTGRNLTEGKRLFDNYCTACHGVDGMGGAPVADNSSGKRYPVPPPNLSGPGNIVSLRTDGYLFFTVRDGANVMPGYGYAMLDEDVWDLVAYMRTMDGTQYAVTAEGTQ